MTLEPEAVPDDDVDRMKAKLQRWGLDTLSALMDTTPADDAPEADAGTTTAVAVSAPAEAAAVVDAPPEWPDMPSAVLPDPVASFVAEAAAAIGCSRAHIATPLLAALGAAIGTTRAVRLKADWREFPVIWSALLAESGGHKSPAFRAALQFANERERDADRDAGAVLLGHEADLERYGAEREAWRRAAAKGQAGDPPRKPDRPPLPRYVVDDCTVEALAPILVDNPRGVLVARDELGGWMASFDRYAGKGGGDAARWNSMHTAAPLSVDRKGGGRLYVPAAAVSICGCIPPRTYTRALGAEHLDNGLAARFLVAMPPRRRKVWSTDSVGFATVDAMRRLFATLYALTPADDGPRVVDLAPDGLAAWRRFYDEHAAEQAAATGAVASMLSKLESYAARLALVVHVCRQAGGEPTLPDRIDADSVAAGVKLVRWYAAEGRRLYRTLLGTGADDSRLVAWIRIHGGRASPRDVARGAPGFKGNTTDAEAALKRLVGQGIARWEPTPTGGRPSDTAVLL